MSEFPVVKPKDVLKALKKAGFIETRSKGSHLQLRKGNLRVTISMHNKDLGHKMLKLILRQARMTVDELKELL